MTLLARLFLPLAAVIAILPAAPAAANDLGAGFSANGGTTLVSDYRFRGISQTDKRAAAQGTFTVAHSSGFYGSWWGSSIEDYVAAGSDVENDFILGYKKSFGSTTVDGGVLYYSYPGSDGVKTNFAEPFVRITQAFGAASLTGTAAYAPKQRALMVDGIHKEDNLYLAGDLGYAIPATPVSLIAHFGHSFGPSYLTIGKAYSDWSLGASIAHKNFNAGLSYVDTNKSLDSPRGRNIAGAGVVASLGVSF